MARKANNRGRSTGQLKRKTKIQGQFAARLIEMLESPAYRELSLSGHRVLARLEIELASHGGQDNGKLPCTYGHFHKYGIHRHAIGPAIRETVALGFVEITEPGRAGNAEWRRPARYRLTYRHDDQHTDPTDEWRKIETAETARSLAQSARMAKSKKSPVPETITKASDEIHHYSHGSESITTGHGSESITTIYISDGNSGKRGTEAASARPSKGQAREAANGAEIIELQSPHLERRRRIALKKAVVEALGGWEAISFIEAPDFEALIELAGSEIFQPIKFGSLPVPGR